jgi:hypothetical protein
MPQHLSFITLTIVLLTTLVFFTYSSPMQYVTHQWQQLSSILSRPYEAPMDGCNGPPEEIVKDSYSVFLHRTYPLDQHKTFVVEHGVDWDTAFDEIISNETESHGLRYGANLDDEALAIVRADIGVDLLICATRAHPT